MAIKLLALDLDGTLLNSASKVSPRNCRSIELVRGQGIVVVLVTGRRFGSARPIALELNLNAPLISHNGALTKNSRSLEVLDHQLLRSSQALYAIEFGHRNDLDILLCDQPEGLGRVIVEEKTLDRNATVTRYLQYVRKLGIELKVVPDLTHQLDGQIIQVLLVGSCERMDEAYWKLRDEQPGEIKVLRTVYQSEDMTIVDCLAPHVSKATGLAAVAEKLSIRRSEIMAIGDNHNDLEMLESVGLPLIMGNADDELKLIGFERTAANDQDGVALAIEKYLL